MKDDRESLNTTYLKVFCTGTTDSERKRENNTGERQEHSEGINAPGCQHDTENDEIETDIDYSGTAAVEYAWYNERDEPHKRCV
jgi:hypothetical protein